MFASVAVPVPALPLLTYRVPPEMRSPARGARVLVPLGTRTMTGLVVATGVAPVDGDVKDLIEVLDEEPFLPAAIVDLALWVSDYYLAGPGDTLAAAMPPGAWVESQLRYRLTASGRAALQGDDGTPRMQVLARLAKGPKTLRGRADTGIASLERDGLIERVTAITGRARAFRTAVIATLTPAGASLAAAQSVAPDATLGARQQAALAALAATGQPQPVGALREHRVDLGTLRRLAGRGLVHLREEVSERDPFAGGAAPVVERDETRALTEEQAAALATLAGLLDSGAYHAALVHGVTGSGKTELYVRLARHTIAQRRHVLILVPEIALTPQVASQFRAALGDRVAIQHSGLADGERHDQWYRIRRGEVDLVVGTRSAVFAPLDRLGLLVVDEEHDGSYKQEETPRYNGRDVAVVRAREAGALVVLGSATPAMETSFNAAAGRYRRVVLSRRVLDRPLASVRIVDLREEYAVSGPDVVLSAALTEAVGARLSAGDQTLLLLNRRGYATSVLCRQCGHVLECPNCSVTLTVHRRAHGPSRALCHYCNYSMRVPGTCVKCAAPYLEQLGFGTDRVLTEVERLFPGIRAGRVDRDTMQKRGAIQDVLARFGRGDLDLLVGTQMIAKGHDFPRVTLVGVVSADLGLGMADFRAAERTFQLLTQVAGRAGRGAQAGEAIIQTIHPDHYSIQMATRQDYDGFFNEELRYRKAMAYPPAVGLVSLVIRGRTYAQAMQDASDLSARLQQGARGSFALLGPAPAPLAKLRGEYRAQIFLKTRHRNATRAALRAALDALPELRRRVTVDVDPMGML
jgi:primosomal protein N' (replication factor Y) (superfamily II helicase)